MFIEKNGDFSGLILGEIDLAKSDQEKNISYNATFKGIASTQNLDRENQVIIQKGLNFAPFIEYGHFNDGHPIKNKQGVVISTGQMVAVPVGKKAWFEKSLNCWKTEGQFLPHVKQANDLVDLAKSFSDIQADRRLGLSVEGKLRDVSEDGNVIKKADIYRITITPQPVNADCELDLLAKAISDEIHYQEQKTGTLLDMPENQKIKTIINLAKSRGIDVDDAIELFYKYAHTVRI